MKIVIAHYLDVIAYPPVISLVDNLLYNGIYVKLIGYNISNLPRRILDNGRFSFFDIPTVRKSNVFDAYKEKDILKKNSK